MSKSYFDGLPGELQTLLVQTAKESAAAERKAFEDQSAAGVEEIKKRGMTVLELSDREKWIELSRPVWAEFAKSTPGAAELIEVIQKSA
jgi:TRAP-type C4-dicarboxylate transport system substrate-binding protein